MEIVEATAVEKTSSMNNSIVGEIFHNLVPDLNLSNESCQVFRGKMLNSIKNVVVKRIEISELNEFEKRMERELKASKESERIQSVLSIEKIECSIDRKFCYIAYEDFDCTLIYLINSNMDCEMKHILLTATEGLMFFHNKGYVHRNIQPQNIVILDENMQMVGKISDLSMSKALADGKNATISRDFSENGCSAPELITFYRQDKGNQKKCRGGNQKKKVNKEVDVFSMGIVFFYALTGYHLFETDGQSLQQNICNKSFKPNFNTLENSKYLEQWEVPVAKQLIKAMVQYEPKKRPTVKHILNHPFFWTVAQKQEFLFVTSQYIQGSDVEKNNLNTQCGLNYNNWKDQVDPKIWNQIQAKKNYRSNVTEFLRLLRNLSAHLNEFKNIELRNFFKDYPGGIVEYFSKLLPNHFHDFYNYMNDSSSYDTFRKFYCDCYLGRYSTHKCGGNENFQAYNWEKFEFS